VLRDVHAVVVLHGVRPVVLIHLKVLLFIVFLLVSHINIFQFHIYSSTKNNLVSILVVLLQGKHFMQ